MCEAREYHIDATSAAAGVLGKRKLEEGGDYPALIIHNGRQQQQQLRSRTHLLSADLWDRDPRANAI
jgi:hypothetical protein